MSVFICTRWTARASSPLLLRHAGDLTGSAAVNAVGGTLALGGKCYVICVVVMKMFVRFWTRLLPVMEAVAPPPLPGVQVQV